VKLWAALYGIIWLFVLEFILALAPQLRPWTTYTHVAIGLLIVLATYSNYSALLGSPAPGRIKRIARATFLMSIGMVVLGLPLLFNLGAGVSVVPGVTVWDGILFVHLLFALAIITQAASVATSYDMWEEKEFAKETAPGEVPPPPRPVRAA
jgi:hypothetical protein